MAENVYDLIIVGAGASGLMAAQEAAAAGLQVMVLESSAHPGAKILMSGGGRCNVTNAVIKEKDYVSMHLTTVRHVLKHYRTEELVAFLASHGVAMKEEEGGKCFPASDQARDVLEALLEAVKASGAVLECQRRVMVLRKIPEGFEVAGAGFRYTAATILLTTGGLSYPATGCDGFGYAVAQQFGHTIIPTVPALTPLTTTETAWTSLQGVSLPCRLTCCVEGSKPVSREGSLLFTHFGFSGPVALDISRYWAAGPEGVSRKITADFFPHLKEAAWIERLATSKKMLRASLGDMIPIRLAQALLHLAGIDSSRNWSALSAAERQRVQERCRIVELPVSAVLGWDKAEVTAGGVDLRELQGATLESRLQPGLFFAGEVLDVDGRVGGFNLHWAWASAVAAARGIVRRVKGGV